MPEPTPTSAPATGTPPEITRLAPSPTGALHLGNIRTFLINWALARRLGWTIVMRVEDLDTPRVKPGTIPEIIEILRWIGIDWDTPEDMGYTLQSADLSPYTGAMEQLAARGMVYPCQRTRGEIAAASAPNEGDHEPIYPASWRPETKPSTFDNPMTNWRLCVDTDNDVTLHDAFAGTHTLSPMRTAGDFLVWTKRGQPAYQLAVVVDDHRQHVTQVVRGDDLIESTGRQLAIMQALGITNGMTDDSKMPPTYTHLPLVRGTDGRRLAKRHGDTRLSTYREQGVPASRVIGLIAFWSGITDQRTPMSALEFNRAFDLATMPKEDPVFTQEDESWLISG